MNEVLSRLADLVPARPRRLLAVFPHPDDESYGLAGTLAKLGDDPDAAAVLMTLTRGEAATAGLEEGLTPAQQGERRSERMRRVAEILRLDALLLRDGPDRRLAYVDPRPIERDVAAVVEAFRPQVVVTFGPRGINAHPDHIATHWIVKRVALEARERSGGTTAARLATMTVPASVAAGIDRPLFARPDDAIDAVLDVSPWAEQKEACLRIHEAYLTVTGAEGLHHRPPVETLMLWGEPPARPPLGDLFERRP